MNNQLKEIKSEYNHHGDYQVAIFISADSSEEFRKMLYNVLNETLAYGKPNPGIYIHQHANLEVIRTVWNTSD